jgi:hypothetical protein
MERLSGCRLLSPNHTKNKPWVRRGFSLPLPKSDLGQERTFGDTTRNVCCWGISGHPMSAFTERCNFSRAMSAHGGIADSLEHLSERLLIADSVEKVG